MKLKQEVVRCWRNKLKNSLFNVEFDQVNYFSKRNLNIVIVLHKIIYHIRFCDTMLITDVISMHGKFC